MLLGQSSTSSVTLGSYQSTTGEMNDGEEAEGLNLPQIEESTNQQAKEFLQRIVCEEESLNRAKAKSPLITSKAEQSAYNIKQTEQMNKNIQDWYSNTGVTAVLVTFFEGHIRISAPDHMEPLKRDQNFKQIFLTTLFKNVPERKEKEKVNTVSEENEIEDVPVSCGICNRTFKDSNQLHAHKLLVHLPKDSQIHQCGKCGKTFQAAAFLQTHQCNRAGRRDHECKICGTRFTTENSLKTHSRIHTDEKPFKCPTCGQSFPRRSSLNYHMAKHTGEKNYKCSVCFKEFLYLNNLRDHERIHSGERPFSCPECGKSFTVSSTLRRHLLVHSGEKPFKCSKCDGCFTRLVHLQSHLRVHSGERPFKCDSCDKSFVQSSHLKRHRKIHDRERTSSSDQCGKEITADKLENRIPHTCTPVPDQQFRPMNFQFLPLINSCYEDGDEVSKQC